MSSELESAECSAKNFRHGFLSWDMDENGKALHLHRSKQKPLSSIKYPRENVAPASKSSNRNKSSSLWNWKPLKALVHFGHHHLNCRFFLHFHAIEGLPTDFNNLSFCISWKRKSEILRTRPVRVSSGIAEFEETLTHQCSISYGSTGAHQSIRYERKLSMLRAFVIEAPALDIGVQWIDLSRLLPLTLSDLNKGRSGKWTTSFRLTGKAKTASLNVCLGYSLGDDISSDPSHFVKIPHIMSESGPNDFTDNGQKKIAGKLYNLDTVSTFSATESLYPPQSRNAKVLGGIVPNRDSELSTSLSMLYQKLEEGKMQGISEDEFYFGDLRSLKPKTFLSDDPFADEGKDCGAVRQGIEVSVKDQLEVENSDNLNLEISSFEAVDVAEIFNEDKNLSDESLELNHLLGSVDHDLHLFDDGEYEHSSKFIGFEDPDSYLRDVLMPSDDMTKYYESENAVDSMLSCRAERLTRSNSLNDIAESIENDFLAMLNLGTTRDSLDSGVSCSPPRDISIQHEKETASCRMSVKETDASSGFKKVKFLDDIDLTISPQPVKKKYVDEGSLLRSRRNAEVLENLETEALMHEWGLNEEAFRYSPRISSGGFGSPVSVSDEEPISLPPIEEGIGPIIQTKDGCFLRSLSPFLFRNANNSARLIVQISSPVLLPAKTGCRNILELLQRWASGGVQKMCVQLNELMPLEDVTGKTMLQLLSEAESTHSAFTRFYEAKSNGDHHSEQIDLDTESFEDLVPVSMAHIEGLLVEGLKIQSGMASQEPPPPVILPTGVSGFHGLDIDDFIKCSLHMKQSITLDSGTKPELLESNFVMALKVQLRDPLRNYEMVGSPMLALIQAEKVETRTSDLLFRLSDAHVAGLNLFNGKKELWGSSRQHQIGSRWLLSSGMVKPNKRTPHFIKSSGFLTKASANALWSISRPNEGEATEWNDRIALRVHARNPDIVFPC